MGDFYKYLVRNNFLDLPEQLSQAQVTKIIREMNKVLISHLVLGTDVQLPMRMGRLEIKKHNTHVAIEDGKVVNDYPIDWKATLELWKEDKHSLEKRVKVKTITKEVFRIYHNKNQGVFKNKQFIDFYPARKLKLLLKENIINGNTDAFLTDK